MTTTTTRPGDVFLNQRGQLLSQFGYISEPASLERSSSEFIFYHYTRPDRLDRIFAPDSGLYARLPVLASELTPELADCFMVEGLLTPLPLWLTANPYFGNLGIEMFKDYVGSVLLRIELPSIHPNIYIADYAHHLECMHLNRRGTAPLCLGYDCRNGQEATRAYVHSYIPACDYSGGHIAPVVQAIRKGEGIAIPCEFIRVSEVQPLTSFDVLGHRQPIPSAMTPAQSSRPPAKTHTTSSLK